MAVTWNGNAARQQLADDSGRLLLALAVTTQTEFRKRLSVSNPRPYAQSSIKGEYLKRRTGWLTAHIVYEPTTAPQAAREGKIRVGYAQNAFYGAIWAEIRKSRKGLLDLLDEIGPQLLTLAKKGP